MTITQRHRLQEAVMVFNVQADQRFRRGNPDGARKLCAYWMRQARKLTDGQLVRVAASC